MVERFLGASVFLLIICMFAPVSHSQGFSIWSDEQKTDCQFFTEAPYTPYNIVIFLDPGEDGAIKAEYKMLGPEGHSYQDIIPSAVVSSASGVWHGDPGISIVFTTCQTEEFPIVSMFMFAPTTTPGAFLIYPHDETNIRGIATCPIPDTLVGVYFYTCFTFNDTCANCGDYYIGNDETSWGAIKEMYR